MSKRKSTVTVPLGLGNRIRAAREDKACTQAELARIVGVSKSAVSQWEQGAVQNLKLGNLFAVAQALEKDVRELVFGQGSVLSIAESPAKYSDIPPRQLALMRRYQDLPKNIRHHIQGLIMSLTANADAGNLK